MNFYKQSSAKKWGEQAPPDTRPFKRLYNATVDGKNKIPLIGPKQGINKDFIIISEFVLGYIFPTKLGLDSL